MKHQSLIMGLLVNLLAAAYACGGDFQPKDYVFPVRTPTALKVKERVIGQVEGIHALVVLDVDGEWLWAERIDLLEAMSGEKVEGPKGWIKRSEVHGLNEHIQEIEHLLKELQTSSLWFSAGLAHMLPVDDREHAAKAVECLERAVSLDPDKLLCEKYLKLAQARVGFSRAKSSLTESSELALWLAFDHTCERNLSEYRRLPVGERKSRAMEFVAELPPSEFESAQKAHIALVAELEAAGGDKEAAKILARRGTEQSDTNHPWRAIGYYTLAISGDSASKAYFVGRAQAYEVVGEKESAASDWAAAAALDEPHDSSITYLTNAIELAPTNSLYYRRRALGYRERDKLDLALADSNKVIELEANKLTAAVFVFRAEIWESKKDWANALADWARVIELEPNGLYNYLHRAEANEQLGQFKKAAADYGRALELDQEDEYRYDSYADALKKAGDITGAIGVMTRAIQKFEDKGDFVRSRGDFHRDKGDLDAAQADYMWLLQLADDVGIAAEEIGQEWLEEQNYARAIEIYDAAIARLGNDADAKLFRLRADAKRLAGNHDAAFVDYEAAVERDSNNVRVSWLVNYYVSHDREADAVKYLNGLVARDPKSPVFLRERAKFHASRDRLDEAAADFAMALSRAGNDERHAVYMERAEAAWKRQDAEAALADVMRALDGFANYEVAVKLGTKILVSQGKLDEALQMANQAIAADAERPGLFQCRAELLRLAGEKEKSIADYSEMVEAAPSAEERKYELLRFDGLIALDEAQAVISEITDLLEEDPDDTELLGKRMDAWKDLKEWLTAIADANEIIRLKPNDYMAFINRADVWYAKEDWEKAAADFGEAIRRDSTKMNGYWGRADAYRDGGHWAKAVEDYKKALALNPNHASLLQNYAWLLATASDENVRDAEQALRYLRDVLKIDGEEDSSYLDTLAAALAESGDFDEAVDTQKRAISAYKREVGKSADEDSQKKLAEMVERLALYEAEQPYRAEPNRANRRKDGGMYYQTPGRNWDYTAVG